MALLVIALLVVSAVVIVVVAKSGAESAQRERERRWSGLAAARGEPSPSAGRGITARAQASAPLRPPEPQPAASGSGRARVAEPVLRVFRRTGGGRKRSEPSESSARDAMVAGRATGAGTARAGTLSPEAARRVAGSAAQNASATARAVRSSASAALRRRPAQVDINNAPVSELQDLPGVGVRAAERIVAYREQNGEFESIEDLTAVDGFDQHRVGRLAPRATV